MDRLIATLRAAGEPTRLRILALLGQGELTVSEIVQILGQSQPRVSRHIKLLSAAGLVHRIPEGAWVFYRLSDADSESRRLADAVIANLPDEDPVLRRDFERLDAIKLSRSEAAERYFAQVAEDWDRIRALHLSESSVEQAMWDMAGAESFDYMIDIGTGTGRVLELFAPRVRRGIGVDINRDMLAVARSNLRQSAHETNHLSIQQADLNALPFEDGVADLVTIHQVMHYLHDPEQALIEAARILKPDGVLLIVDFAPHQLEFLRTDHAHRRLGLSDDEVQAWIAAAGLDALDKQELTPTREGERLTVNLWTFKNSAKAELETA